METKVKENTVYQTFEDLDVSRISKSKEKLDLLKFDPSCKTILDIGCNSGYFPIRFIQGGAKYCIGIDVDEAGGAGGKVIYAAKEYAKHYGVDDKTEFHIADFLGDREPVIKITTITCLSTFHYFRGKQEYFFDKCARLLQEDGELILELGVSQTEKLERYSRNASEEPCEYPNRETLLARAKQSSFEVVYVGRSVDQAGDKIPRYVYHFKKK